MNSKTKSKEVDAVQIKFKSLSCKGNWFVKEGNRKYILTDAEFRDEFEDANSEEQVEHMSRTYRRKAS